MINKKSREFISKHFSDCKVFKDKYEMHSHYLDKAPTDGMVCEFGVYQGVSLNKMAKKQPYRTFYGFDSFNGLPEDWRPTHKKGAFEIDFKSLKFEPNVEIYAGYFNETLKPFLNDTNQNISLLHIDCDLYSSTKEVLYELNDRLNDDTIFIFDELLGYDGFEEHELKALHEYVDTFQLSIEYLAYKLDESSRSKCVQVVLRLIKNG